MAFNHQLVWLKSVIFIPVKKKKMFGFKSWLNVKTDLLLLVFMLLQPVSKGGGKEAYFPWLKRDML